MNLINRAGGAIIRGKTHFWTDWHIDQIHLDQPMCKIEDYIVPGEWLDEIFDERFSGYLMMMPREIWN